MGLDVDPAAGFEHRRRDICVRPIRPVCMMKKFTSLVSAFPRKLTNRQFIIIGVMGAVLLASLGFMVVDRKQVISYESFSLHPTSVRPGERLSTRFKVKRWRECPGTVYRVLFYSDGTKHPYDPIPAAIADDFKREINSPRFKYPRDDELPRSFHIPPDYPGYKVPRGPTIYQAQVHYHCNILQKILNWPVIATTARMPFEIVD